MKRNIPLYLQDILENMRDAEEFTLGLNFEQFKANKKTLNATLRALEVIGEASKRVPDEIRTRYASVPWKEMAGMRDKLIHDYFSVDSETVWLVVKERIPTLKPLIEQILRDLAEQTK